MNLGRYSKSIAAFVGTVLTWAGATYVPTGHVTRVGWYALAVALATAAGVYSVTNSPAEAGVLDRMAQNRVETDRPTKAAKAAPTA